MAPHAYTRQLPGLTIGLCSCNDLMAYSPTSEHDNWLIYQPVGVHVTRLIACLPTHRNTRQLTGLQTCLCTFNGFDGLLNHLYSLQLTVLPTGLCSCKWLTHSPIHTTIERSSNRTVVIQRCWWLTLPPSHITIDRSNNRCVHVKILMACSSTRTHDNLFITPTADFI